MSRRDEYPRALRGANPRPREEPSTPLVPRTEVARVTYPKVKPVRSRSYLDHVRALPCAWCGKSAPSEASHHGAHGMSSKADDYRTIPLCHEHHDEHHRTMRMGQMTAEDSRAWEAEMIIRTLILFLTRQQ